MRLMSRGGLLETGRFKNESQLSGIIAAVHENNGLCLTCSLSCLSFYED